MIVIFGEYEDYCIIFVGIYTVIYSWSGCYSQYICFRRKGTIIERAFDEYPTWRGYYVVRIYYILLLLSSVVRILKKNTTPPPSQTQFSFSTSKWFKYSIYSLSWRFWIYVGMVVVVCFDIVKMVVVVLFETIIC